MEYARIGAGGCSISRVGFGCASISGYDYGPVDESAWIRTVRAALDCGINFFDVADVYGLGRGEEMLSRALGDQRHKVVVATKFGLVWDSQGSIHRDASPKKIEQALDESLRRLRIESITLYQLHWPDTVTPLGDILETLKLLQDRGKIQFIGLSNVSLEQLEFAHRTHPVDSVQVPYNLLCRGIEDNFLSWCEVKQVAVLAHSGLARGLLSGKRPLGSHFKGSDTRNQSAYFAPEGRQQKEALVDALCETGRRAKRSPAAAALRWLLDHRQVASVLVGMNNLTQLRENLQAVGWRLPCADYELLSFHSASCPGTLSGTLANKRL